MYNLLLGKQEEVQAIPITTQTQYQPPTLTPIGSTYPSTTLEMGARAEINVNSRLNLVVNRVFNSQPFSPAPNAQLFDILLALKEKRVDELNCLLTDKNSYNSFLHSLESVRHLNLLRLELIKGNADLARNNLAKDSQIAELRNQCTIIRTSELATAREKFEEVQKSEKEISAIYSSSMLLSRLRETATKVDEAAERLQCKLLASDIDLSEFIYQYRKERILYHTQMLVHVAAKTSMDALMQSDFRSSCFRRRNLNSFFWRRKMKQDPTNNYHLAQNLQFGRAIE